MLGIYYAPKFMFFSDPLSDNDSESTPHTYLESITTISRAMLVRRKLSLRAQRLTRGIIEFYTVWPELDHPTSHYPTHLGKWS